MKKIIFFLEITVNKRVKIDPKNTLAYILNYLDKTCPIETALLKNVSTLSSGQLFSLVEID